MIEVETEDPQSGKPLKNQPVVVGVGASAGGLEAIAHLLSNVPKDFGMAFVIVQHLSPDHDSALAEILTKRVHLPIHQVAGNTKVEPNHVYVIPPGKYLSIDQCELKLTDPPDARGSRMAIDFFFRSLAEDACEHGVGVVLSGTGSDGTAGLKEIKHYGGLTIAQDPDEAAHRGMPQSAVNSGSVDLIVPVGDIAERLMRYVEHARQHGPLSAQALTAMEQIDIDPVVNLLRKDAGHDFRNYRSATLSRRITRRMGLQGVEQIQDYVAILADNRNELLELKRDLLIGVTRFFRNPESWEMLTQKAIKPLVDQSDGKQALRVWIAGCATGEEAYSMAMLFHEQVSLCDKPVPIQIFASDVSAEALDFARAGVYTDAVVADVPVERLRRFFQKVDGGYRVSKQLRESVVFAEQNVLAQAPFSKLDLISCRNMLIYLRRTAQQSVLSVFQFALKQHGYLFLGSSETVERTGDLFEAINPTHRIYRRTRVKAYPPSRAATAEPDETTQETLAEAMIRVNERQPTPRIGIHVYRQLMQELEHGVAVINRENRVLYMEGRADLYLQLNMGEVETELPDVFALAREGVKAKLRTMIRNAQQSSDPVEETTRVRRDGKLHPCRICIRQLSASIGEDGALLLTFEPLRSDALPQPPVSVSNDEPSSDVQELRHDLLTTREQLSTTIAQLETANEELKASNEEAMTMNEQLQSGNEELETPKEELQSLNEELTTLNNQLELKLGELQHTTDDLNNLLTSSSIPTIFLDTNLRIRRFTPTCKDLYNFIPSDIGRPLADIVRLHDDEALIEDAKKVLKNLVPIDKDIICSDGRCFIRRILPYRTEDDRIQGVVLTFADVSAVIDAQNEASRNMAVLQSVYMSAPVGLAFMDADLNYMSINERLAEINGFPADEHIGKNLRDIIPDELVEELVVQHRRVIDENDPLLNVEVVGQTAASVDERIWSCSYVPVEDESGGVIGINIVVQDVTESKRYELDLTDSRDRLEIALAAGRMGTWHWDLVNDKVVWSDQMFDLFGVNRNEFKAQRDSFTQRVHPDDREATRQGLQQSLENGDTVYRNECRIVRDNDRTVVWVERRAVIRRDESGNPVSMTGVTIDVTERHQHEESLREAKEAAEAANRSRGEFMANMSHEIRTPMTAILGYADMLAGHLADPDDMQCVHTIRRNGRFLLEIIDDILDLSKIDAGKFEVERERIAPEEIIADIVSLMNVRAEEKNIPLQVEFDGELPALIETDGKRLRQILLNLIGNAIKFTHEGQVRLIARYNHDDNMLELAVEDTGIGIDRRKQEVLFKPFTQADGSITRSYGGSGLGLAISHRLAEILGGGIEVESVRGRGSTFTVTIDPGSIDDVEFVKPSLAITSSPSEDETVELTGRFLIVDDRRDIRYLAQHFIETVGGTVSTAGDGQEGVDAVQSAIDKGEPFAAVCMDMQMPVMDGFGATREIRRRGIEVPIVALTANAMQGDQDACIEAGCTAFVSKPIDKTALLKTLSKLSSSGDSSATDFSESREENQ